MIKPLYATSIISYGPDLPTGTSFPDGAVFIKTEDPGSGMYIFGLNQDTDVSTGDQPGRQWVFVSGNDFLPLSGGTLTGDLRVGGTGAIGGVAIKRNSGLGSSPGEISFINGAGAPVANLGWNQANGRFELTGSWWLTSTPLVNGNTVWHAGNDGLGSGLDADFLDGQDSSFFLNAGNMNAGILSLTRGGTGADLSGAVTGGITYRGPASLEVTPAGVAGQVLLSGGMAAPAWVNQAALSVGYATNAAAAISAGSASTAGTASNVDVLNDATTNATVYPTWVSGSSGSLPVRTSSPKLTFNPDTGTLSATAFVGSGAGLTNLPVETIPAGTIVAFAASTPPAGWLVCNGAAVSRTTFANLFAVIGTTYGVGDGVSTFNLPDLRGEFIRGWDAGRGADPGRGFATWQPDEFRSHVHGMPTNVNEGGGTVANENTQYTPNITIYTYPAGGDETRPRNVALLYIIKT